MPNLDPELDRYRRLMTVPDKFEEGFSLTSFIGVLFVALVMVPGGIYMDLLLGGSLSGAAQWVTVILFAEVAKRANARLSRPMLYILFYMSGSILGGGIKGNLLFNQFLVHSDAASGAGLTQLFPNWYAPKDSAAYDTRSFFQLAWMPALGMWLFSSFMGKLDGMVLGYGLFRLASDVERLPFPMAPLGAQGMLAIADDLEGHSETSWRWRAFAIGGALGLAFTILNGAIPTLTGSFFHGDTYTIFPIPWAEWGKYTKDYLPAVATGITIDLGLVITGTVVPFWGVIGGAIGIAVTMALNPALYHFHILKSWLPGDDTNTTTFKNGIDFYTSFGVGISLAFAAIGIRALFRMKKTKAEIGLDPRTPGVIPAGRGDIPNYWVLICYFVSTIIYITVCGYVVHWHRGVMVLLIFFGFIYTPIISYVTARLVGLMGMAVEIPYIKEMTFILSGYRGIDIWFMPLPMSNYGYQVGQYRTAELTGTRFPSMWKADIILFPIVIIAAVGFASFIWNIGEIPSTVFPYANKMWDLQAKQQVVVFTSTTGEYSQFSEALRFSRVGLGFTVGTVLFAILSWFQAPLFFIYGLIGGIGGSMHGMFCTLAGALLGKYYLQKKLGLRWMEYAPVVGAGYGCGAGLVLMFCIGLVFLSKSASSLPY